MRCGDCCKANPCSLPDPVDIAVLRYLGYGLPGAIGPGNRSVYDFMIDFDFFVLREPIKWVPVRKLCPKPIGKEWESGCRFESFSSDGQHVCALMECKEFRDFRLNYQGEFDCERSDLCKNYGNGR